ncbi:SSI family serine proteinase inhibitor [Parafrankia elaeagni]|uniref:SSI family serine proteinase inhibitor n=1 Tax=Parafrankia elaeagni TaxID=222534 RepID=UPI000369334E|nr:SSI family serine proteinase inhibitor [Parafrankia elaeagni]
MSKFTARFAARWAAFAFAAAIAVVAVAPASASAYAGPGPVRGAFILTVSAGEKPYQGKPVVLICPPNAATSHPNPVQACAAIAKAGGDFDRLPIDPAVLCPFIYDPVTATADGRWGKKAVHWTKTFGNSCLLYAETNPVF